MEQLVNKLLDFIDNNKRLPRKYKETNKDDIQLANWYFYRLRLSRKGSHLFNTDLERIAKDRGYPNLFKDAYSDTDMKAYRKNEKYAHLVV